MRKLLLLFLLVLILCSCERSDISDNLFIASVGFQKEEDGQLYGYFYLPMSSDIGKSENTESKGKGDFAKVKGRSVAEIFNNVEVSISLDINLRHISSFIVCERLLTSDFLEELCNFIKYSLDIDFNFYLFSTKEKISDIYSFQNPNQESVLNSILVSTAEFKDLYLVTPPMHFLEFVRKFYLERTILFPLLDLEEIWTVEGEQVKNVHPQSAIYYYKNKTKKVIKDPSSPYMKNTLNFYDSLKETTIRFYNYEFKLSFDEKVKIDIKFNYQIFSNNVKITKEEIIQLINNHINTFIKEYEEVDPLDLNYYNYIYNKNYTYQDIVINIQPPTNN